MEFEPLYQFITEQAREHWPKAAASIACLVVGAWWGKRRARSQWAKKEFHDRINISLNILREGKLMIRTLLETDLATLFLNAVAVDKVRSAIPRTVPDDPLLPVSKDDAWFLLNAVLNEISERTAIGHLRQDLNAPTVTGRYLVCLTYECAGAVRTRKVRAMVIRKESLLNLPDETPLLESPTHATRFETLQKLAAEYRKDPSRFLEMEISV